MKLGFSLNAYTKKSLPTAIKSISKIGFSGIEIVLDIPHAFLPLKKSKIEKIKRSLKTWNLKVTNLNANTVLGWHIGKKNPEKFEPSLSTNNEKLRKWRINYTKQAIDLACELKSPSISITSGLLKKTHKDTYLNNFRNSLNELASYAEERKIKIAIEYEPNLLIENSKDVSQFLNSEHDNVGINLDTCHAAVLGENIPKLIKNFHKKIFHTHISDCKNQKHYHLIPGLGEIDFVKMYLALQKIKYNGYLTAELYTYSQEPDKAAKDTLNYFKKLMN